MTLKDLKTKDKTLLSLSNELDSRITSDGTLTLYSHYYKERFHSGDGARKESEEKFISPSQLNRFTPTNKIHLLDVCFGMGYNTGCFVERIFNQKVKFQTWGLEIDKRPLEFGLRNNVFIICSFSDLY